MEVKAINKQKFLAELGRLLTFMYEEDRQTALAMYSKMFDDAAEEQLLLQFLVSPTRQAVVLARAYDAKERKLQVHTQSRDDDAGYTDVPEGELPPFILAISGLQQEAIAQGIFEPVEAAPAVDEDQFSLFDEFPQDTPAEQDAVWTDVPSVPQNNTDMQEPDPAEDEDAPVSDSVSEFADAVDAFLADFAIADGELVPKSAEAPAPAEDAPVPSPAETEEAEEAPVPAESGIPVSVTEPELEEEQAPATQRKAKVFLLILYILCAIPLGILGIAALLVPTLLSLSLAIGFVSAGVLVLTAAFGLKLVADLMVILGLALVLLALGLLLTWLFIWFIGGAIVGLIRGLCHLGGKWCYKEVPVQ